VADSAFTKELTRALSQRRKAVYGIPSPTRDLGSLHTTVERMKEAVETLLRVRNDPGESALRVKELEPILTVVEQVAQNTVSKLEMAPDIIERNVPATYITVDSADPSGYVVVEWMVHLRVGTAQALYWVTALHDGTAVAAPTLVEFVAEVGLEIGDITQMGARVILQNGRLLLQVKGGTGIGTATVQQRFIARNI